MYLPDVEDCSVFYECYGGRAIKFHCPPGMDWDFDNYKCDTRIVGDCAKLKLKREQFYSPAGRCPLLKEPLMKPAKLPDDHDCSIYYECHGKFPFVHRCPFGSLFDMYLTECVYGPNARCYHRISNDLREH